MINLDFTRPWPFCPDVTPAKSNQLHHYFFMTGKTTGSVKEVHEILEGKTLDNSHETADAVGQVPFEDTYLHICVQVFRCCC